MQKSDLFVDQLSYTNMSISERDLLTLIPFNHGQITINKSSMIAVMMLLQLLMALVLMALMIVA